MFSGANTVLWVILIAAFACCAFWHIRENRYLSQQWHKDLDAFSAKWMTRFAWSRTVQLLIALAVGMVIMGMYDWQWHKVRQLAAALPQAAATAAPPTHGSSAPVSPANNIETNDYYPPATAATASEPANTPLPASDIPATTVDTALAKPAKSAAPTIADVYDPEENTTGDPSRMDSIKKRYENLLITYLFLKKCNKTQPADYHVITSALAQDMASVNAPGRLQYDIQTAANGSFKEIYTNTRCDTAGIDTLVTQYRDYITKLTGQTGIPQ